ncbi:MAG: hypothetical protein IPJ19_15525 [Planctomycetes bacterium]|nr:hypothetical protein [Planctomycetota bacterium]
MTTQSTTYPDSAVPSTRKLPADTHSNAEVTEAASNELRGRLRHAMDSSKERLTEWKGGFEEGVRSRPFQSILIAAAVGATIGMLLGRRSR